jgi:glycosyltransferase involved in cell wall biosynthesis
MKIALLHSIFDYAGGSSATEHLAHVCQIWVDQGDDIRIFSLYAKTDLGPLNSYVKSNRVSVQQLVPGREQWPSHSFSPTLAEHALALLRDYQPDVIYLTDWKAMWGVAEAIICEKIAPLAYIPYDFSLVCFRTHLLNPAKSICSGPESGTKCRDCILRAEINEKGGWFIRLMPAALIEKLRPTYGWKQIYQETDALVARRKSLLGGFDLVFAPSKVMQELLIKYGADSGRTKHFVYGVDPAKVGDGRKSSSNMLRLGYFGHDAYYKGLWVLGKALLLLPADTPLRLVVFVESALDLINREWPPEIRHFVISGKFVRGENMAHAYRDIDAVVVPSVWHENSPFVVLESLANRTPVLASDQLGISEHILHGYNGYLVEPGNARDWADLFVELAHYPQEKLKAMSENCSYRRTHAEYAKLLRASVEHMLILS